MLMLLLGYRFLVVLINILLKHLRMNKNHPSSNPLLIHVHFFIFRSYLMIHRKYCPFFVMTSHRHLPYLSPVNLLQISFHSSSDYQIFKIISCIEFFLSFQMLSHIDGFVTGMYQSFQNGKYGCYQNYAHNYGLQNNSSLIQMCNCYSIDNTE